MEYLDSLKQILLQQKKGLNPKEFSSLSLAYVGDAIFEIFVRTFVLSCGNAPVNRLHKKARDLVNAKAQAKMYYQIAEYFTEEENAVFKRGRNAKSFTVPKNADLTDYRHATGLEAVFGYLYLEGKLERAIELFQLGIESEEKK